MTLSKQKMKYPENLYLKDEVENSGQTVKHIAKVLGVSRKVVSDTINGHYKGTNIIPLLKSHLKIK
ncbi:Uncharacterised protein [Sphingobacterium spiritivorum]|uniref:Uncharacterized protein n=1 Tax=Sphingobacterium spiritivorum TaxID=258 RepID=A0A380CQ47_SPHSI|nr:Uncharacterised protein [Sphingobacterium spiritivorum]